MRVLSPGVILCLELQITPIWYFSPQKFQIHRKIVDRIYLSRVEQQSSLQQGQPNRERLSCYFISTVVLRPLGYEFHLFWCQIGQCFLERCLIEVGPLVGPTINISYFDLSLFVDKDIVRADIPNFSCQLRKFSRATDQRIQQIP